MKYFLDNPIVFGITSKKWKELSCIGFSEKSVSFFSDENEKLFSFLLSSLMQGKNFFIGLKNRQTTELLEVFSKFGIVPADINENSNITLENEVKKSEVIVATSGTTGSPKIFRHDVFNLFKSVQLGDSSPKKWILTYSPGTFAWFQMVFTCLSNSEQTLVIPDSNDPKAIFLSMEKNFVNAISSTPSLWKYFLVTFNQEEIRNLPLKQITLGGEPVRQDILDLLSDLFPRAKISHIYASSEVGSTFVVNDGKEGFPISWMDGKNGVCFKVDSNQLYVKSFKRASDINEWHETGDLVEIINDRVVVIGRTALDTINVGGLKVSKSFLEQKISQISFVSWVKVRPVKSMILGQLVGVSLVVNIPEEEARNSFQNECVKLGLEEWMIPKSIKFLKAPELGNNFKV